MHPALAIAPAMAAALVLAACSPEPKVAGPNLLVSSTEVSAFYHGHPALFAARKVYAWRSLSTDTPAQRLAGLTHPSDLDAVEGWLRAEGIAFTADRTRRAAEDVPLALLPSLAHMRPGEIAILQSRRGALIVQLVAATAAPLTEREAAPLIERFLEGRKRAQLAARVQIRS